MMTPMTAPTTSPLLTATTTMLLMHASLLVLVLALRYKMNLVALLVLAHDSSPDKLDGCLHLCSTPCSSCCVTAARSHGRKFVTAALCAITIAMPTSSLASLSCDMLSSFLCSGAVH